MVTQYSTLGVTATWSVMSLHYLPVSNAYLCCSKLREDTLGYMEPMLMYQTLNDPLQCLIGILKRNNGKTMNFTVKVVIRERIMPNGHY